MANKTGQWHGGKGSRYRGTKESFQNYQNSPFWDNLEKEKKRKEEEAEKNAPETSSESI